MATVNSGTTVPIIDFAPLPSVPTSLSSIERLSSEKLLISEPTTESIGFSPSPGLDR
jgi:hypothetical protein